MKKTGIELRKILFFTLLLVFSLTRQALTAPEQSFDKANQLYRAGRFAEALNIYEGLIHQGLESGNLYFNCGNAYFKQGRWGKAVLNYERASRFMPRDTDLRFNMRLARERAGGYVVTAKQSWFTRSLERIFGELTIDESVKALYWLYLSIVGLCGTVLYLRRSRRLLVCILTLFLAVFSLDFVFLSLRRGRLGKEAIIISTEVNAKYEPAVRGIPSFIIPEGTKVLIIDGTQGWKRIRHSDGRIGWVPQGTLEII